MSSCVSIRLAVTLRDEVGSPHALHLAERITTIQSQLDGRDLNYEINAYQRGFLDWKRTSGVNNPELKERLQHRLDALREERRRYRGKLVNLHRRARTAISRHREQAVSGGPPTPPPWAPPRAATPSPPSPPPTPPPPPAAALLLAVGRLFRPYML
jgi:hypothetical protein